MWAMSEEQSGRGDLFGSNVLAIFFALLLSWAGVVQSNMGNSLGFVVFTALAVFAVPRVRSWALDRRDYRSRLVIWVLRVVYLFAGITALSIAVLKAGGSGVGVMMVVLLLFFAAGIVFGIRIWRVVRTAAGSD